MRIMLFSAKGAAGMQDIAFPYKVEIKIDRADVKGFNWHGIKNKPGTTPPADLTDALLVRPAYDKIIDFFYADTVNVSKHGGGSSHFKLVILVPCWLAN